MSIGSLGVLGSVSTGQLQQTRGAESDRAIQDAQTQAREVDAARQAEAAEGIGQMSEDEKTSDRDADGRRLWERPERRKSNDEPEPLPDNLPRSIDPTGESGGNVDLSG